MVLLSFGKTMVAAMRNLVCGVVSLFDDDDADKVGEVDDELDVGDEKTPSSW